MAINEEKMIEGISLFLDGIGIDKTNQHFIQTPCRVAKAWKETFCKGYEQNEKEILSTYFEEDHDTMVMVKDIHFCSMCAHHILPFFGVAKIAYIPNKKIVGISKLARILDMYARRLQIQENLTNQVAQAIMKHLEPAGVGVILKAQHFCMTERGAMKPGSVTITSCLTGAMKDDEKTRAEFLAL